MGSIREYYILYISVVDPDRDISPSFIPGKNGIQVYYGRLIHRPGKEKEVPGFYYYCTTAVYLSVVKYVEYQRKHTMWELAVVALALLAPVSVSGFVAPLSCRAAISRGSSAAAVAKAMTGSSDSAEAKWALIFDCDGVILEVQQ